MAMICIYGIKKTLVEVCAYYISMYFLLVFAIRFVIYRGLLVSAKRSLSTSIPIIALRTIFKAIVSNLFKFCCV